MSDILGKNLFLVKEHIGMFKAANNFDIYDPENGEIIMECREEKLGAFTKIFRFTKYKRNTPFDIQVRTMDGQQVVRVKRGTSFFLSKVEVFDENNELIGIFKQKFLTIGGGFNILDADEQPVCHLKGKWTGWEFKFIVQDVELAKISKKWTGMGKEFFTSADNYVLQLSEELPADNIARPLIVAAVMCIDMVLKP